MKRVLLIQLRQLGDIILTTPSIRALRKHYPDAQIDFLSHRMGRLILENNPDINSLYTYSESDRIHDKIALMWQLRRNRYDLVIDFMHNPRSALFAFMTRSPKRISFESRRRWAFTETFRHPSERVYIVREKFALLEPLGISCQDERLVLPWQKGDLKLYTDFQNKHPEFAQAPIRCAISATHRRMQRRWPLERYAELSDRMVRNWGACVVWLWGPGEKQLVQDAIKLCHEPVVLAPEGSFSEFSAFLCQFDFFVGNSNGPSHVAVAAQIPTLQLHGSSFAKSWSPMKGRHQAIQSDAMANISVESVWQAAVELQPFIENMARFREQNGDRMSWQQIVDI